MFSTFYSKNVENIEKRSRIFRKAKLKVLKFTLVSALFFVCPARGIGIGILVMKNVEYGCEKVSLS